jgi:hypothetical protein
LNSTLPGTNRTGGESKCGHNVQRIGQWLDQTFIDPRLCAAIVDRLTYGGTIIETGTQSYRLARTKDAHDG